MGGSESVGDVIGVWFTNDRTGGTIEVPVAGVEVDPGEAVTLTWGAGGVATLAILPAAAPR